MWSWAHWIFSNFCHWNWPAGGVFWEEEEERQRFSATSPFLVQSTPKENVNPSWDHIFSWWQLDIYPAVRRLCVYIRDFRSYRLPLWFQQLSCCSIISIKKARAIKLFWYSLLKVWNIFVLIENMTCRHYVKDVDVLCCRDTHWG